MKILLVHNEYQQPGGEDVVFRLEGELLARFGHTVLKYRRSNHEIHADAILARARLLKHLIWAEDSRRDISEILRRERPDIVHVHNTFLQISPSVFAACHDAGIPVVQTLHNFRLLCPAATFFRQGHWCEECVDRGLWRGVVHGCYRGSRTATASVAVMLKTHRALGTWEGKIDRFIAPSEFTRQKYVECGFSSERISVKPNFVFPDPGPAVEKGDYAIFIGRLAEGKGVETLLRAWSRLGNSIPLFVAGDGPLRAKLEEQQARSASSAVRFLGRLQRDEALKALKAARFVVVPSEWYEVFPMTIVESFACGTPVICSRLGALHTIVEDSRTGILFAPGDDEDLAEKVVWAWTHPARLKEIGSAARQQYEQQYTAEKNYEILTEIYRRTMNDGRSKAAPLPGRVSSSGERRQPAAAQPVARKSGAAQPAPRFQVLGVPVDSVQIPEAVARIEGWIQERARGRFVAVTGMHGVMEAQRDPEFKTVLKGAGLVVADGMPLVWLGRLGGLRMRRRVYGPELMDTFCRVTGPLYRHFFYGGAEGVPALLAEKLRQKYAIRVAGSYSPPFRPLTAEERAEINRRIEAASPDVLWVGLSTPKQERWMWEQRAALDVPVMIGVGAAFDFSTGRVRQAPSWMREHGLEWLFRLLSEPRRLWRRYLVYGSGFVLNVSLELLRLRTFN